MILTFQQVQERIVRYTNVLTLWLVVKRQHIKKLRHVILYLSAPHVLKLDVDERIDNKTFVTRNSLIFCTGRGFYEFWKPEKISSKKEVVLVDKISGDIYTGSEACRVIGAGGSGKIKPTDLEKWWVFVPSTSYNRVLMPDTGFLDDVDPDY